MAKSPSLESAGIEPTLAERLLDEKGWKFSIMLPDGSVWTRVSGPSGADLDGGNATVLTQLVEASARAIFMVDFDTSTEGWDALSKEGQLPAERDEAPQADHYRRMARAALKALGVNPP